jgi:hypothetical protein
VYLTEVVRKTQTMMGRMRSELQWLSGEKEKAVAAAQVELEKDRAKHKEELAKALTREQALLAAALVQPNRASSRTMVRGSPRRRVAPTTTPGRRPQVVSERATRRQPRHRIPTRCRRRCWPVDTYVSI